MADKLSEEEVSLLANFVFKGTVRKLRAATMPEVPVTARTAVVRVDEIVEAPATMADFAGRDITVELGGSRKVKVGEQSVFYANGWIFGEGLAVRSLDQRPAAAAAGMAVMGATPGNPVQNLEDKRARTRFERSSLVISGRVKSVRLPSPQLTDIGAIGAMGAAGAVGAGPGAPPQEVKPVSEHDPVMQEAVVEVESVHKGTAGGSEMTVLFPSSTDVQWYSAPKFRPGQQGFFMLHKEEKKAALPGVMGAAGAIVSAVVEDALPADAFTALHPADFQPLDRPGGIRNLISDTPAPVADEED